MDRKRQKKEFEEEIKEMEIKVEISDAVKYVGVNDYEIDLFEGQYKVPNGMAYNSYVILDEKIAVLDTVDEKFTEEWLENLAEVLGGRKPEYLIIHHMEPDHSAGIEAFIKVYPDTKIAASQKAFVMMEQFFDLDFADRKIVVSEGDTLLLGQHELTFILAPMVHWPEVMVSYERSEKILFSADAFGKFGALDAKEGWACEARRYYFGIVGKYGIPVQNLLKKAETLDIQMICPLHGPVLREREVPRESIANYLRLYKIWSSYEPENKGVLIAYTSVYGNTKKAVEILAEQLREKGCPKVKITDLARDDMAEAVEDAFRYEKLVLATITYSGTIFPFMREFIAGLTERNYQNRTVAFIENGTWSMTAAKTMKDMLSGCKNLNFTTTTVSIKSAVKEATRIELEKLAEELV